MTDLAGTLGEACAEAFEQLGFDRKWGGCAPLRSPGAG